MLRLVQVVKRISSTSARRAGRGQGVVRRGFTLLEMMLVVLIMGLLVTVSIVAIGGNLKSARIGTTIASLGQIKSALQQYQMQNATYPETLEALVPKYIERVPLDAWKKPIVYRFPGSNSDATKPFDLFSTGGAADGVLTDTIDVWTMETKQ